MECWVFYSRWSFRLWRHDGCDRFFL